MDNNIKHIWSVNCRKGVAEAETNILSLMEIVEEVNVNIKAEAKIKPSEKTPVVIPFNFEIISFWQKPDKKQPANSETKAIISSPAGKELLKKSIELKIPKDKKNLRTIARVDVLPVVGSGTYQITVQQKKGAKYITVAELPLEVIIREQK